MTGTVKNYSTITEEMLARPPDADWLMHYRNYSGWSYSPLNQITPRTAVPPGDASIVQTFLGEGRADMARSAVALPSENLQARALLGRERRAVSVDEPVVRVPPHCERTV